MNGRGYRIIISGLIALIVALAGAAWWMVSFARPSLVFYLGTALVGLLVWFELQRGGEKNPQVQASEDATTLPECHDSMTKG